MKNLLEDTGNLLLMEKLVSGNAVSVSLNSLSRLLRIHRNTVKKRVNNIFNHNIVNSPVFTFLRLYKIFPLLVVLHINVPYDKKFEEWIKEDPHIFAAFKTQQGDYNTLLFIYHENITGYQLWMDSLPSILKLRYRIHQDKTRFVSSTSYFSNQLMLKYNPSSGINLIERDFEDNGEVTINGYKLDETDLQLLKCLVFGKGIKVNQTLLCKELGLHRKTVVKRISNLLREGLLNKPVCRFPNFFVPPNYLLTYSLVEVKKLKSKVISEIVKDPCIPIALKIVHDKYNLLVFGNHRNIGDHLRWEEGYRRRFPNSLGSANKTYLSPEMAISFNQQIVSLSIIRNKLETSRGKELRKTYGPLD